MWRVAILLPFFALPSADAATFSLKIPRFQFEVQAQQYCPADSVVWVVPSRGLYNSRSERWYGQTNNGTYACARLTDAGTAGYRASSTASAAP
jgi:hypothetical protein